MAATKDHISEKAHGLDLGFRGSTGPSRRPGPRFPREPVCYYVWSWFVLLLVLAYFLPLSPSPFLLILFFKLSRVWSYSICL